MEAVKQLTAEIYERAEIGRLGASKWKQSHFHFILCTLYRSNGEVAPQCLAASASHVASFHYSTEVVKMEPGTYTTTSNSRYSIIK